MASVSNPSIRETCRVLIFSRMPHGATFRLVGEAVFLTTKLSVGAALWRNSKIQLAAPRTTVKSPSTTCFFPSSSPLGHLEDAPFGLLPNYRR